MSECYKEFWLDSEYTYRLIVDIAEEGIWILDPGDRIVFANKKLQAMLGYAKDELLCRTLYDIVAAEDRDALKKALDRRRRGETENYPLRLVKKDGAPVWVMVAAAPVMNKRGEYMGVVGLGSEITQLKQAEEALHESLEKFRVLAETSSAVIYVYQDENPVYVNDAAERVGGYSKDELYKMKFWDMVHPDFREMVKERGLARQRGETVPSSYEVKFITKSGETRWVELTSGRFTYMGKPAGIATIFDITERKRAEDTLRESEEKYRNLVENVNDTVWQVDEKFVFTYISPQIFNAWGYTPEEVIGKTSMDFMQPEEAERVSKIIKDVVGKRDKLLMYENRHLRKDGRIMYIEVSGQPIIDKNGVYRGYRGVLRDITERKRAEEALRESEEKFRVLAETSAAAIIVFQDKWPVSVNKAAERITGYSRDELLKMNYWDIVHPEFQELVKDRSLARQRGELAPSRYEVKLLTKSGEERWAELTAGRIIYMGKPAGVATMFDITDRKRAEEALSDAKAQAEFYVDLMGHDINNLNQVALGYLELADGVIRSDGELGDNIELIEKPIESLNSSSKLIGKVMMVRKLKMGEIKLDRVDVCKALIRICDRYSHVRGRDVTINYIPPGECLVMANELIDEIFINLIENSIKHSSKDRPLVINILQTKACENDKEYFRILIEDNGPGISDTVKEKLFARFSRGETKAMGKGLGLFLIKTLVEDFQGKVWVEDSVSGDYTKGARFVVMLPAIDH
jgi:PAS domain S-box-containing protein